MKKYKKRTIYCPYCEKTKIKRIRKQAIFCSRECYLKAGMKPPATIKRNFGKNHPFFGKHLSKSHRDRISKGEKGKIMSEEFKKRISLANKGKIIALETRRKLSRANSGKNGSNWRGGITKENKIIRRSLEYRLWREAVFRRDNWTCIWCKKRGGRLEADHIKPFSLFPELRLAIDNGRTLCESCHRKTDTWGNRIKKHEKK